MKENRKFHGWRHGVGRAGVVDRAVISRRRGAGGHQWGLSIIPMSFNAWSFVVMLDVRIGLQSSTALWKRP